MNVMIQLKQYYINSEPYIIEQQYTEKKREQKPNSKFVDKQSRNFNKDYNIQDYYQLFQQGKVTCEALECNIIATTKLKIPIGFNEDQIFFFCENCISKFLEVK